LKTKELVNYELSKLKTNIVQENIIVHKEVESVTKETQSKFTEFEIRLNQLQKKVVGGTSPQQNLVINGNESEMNGCASPKNAGGTRLKRTGDVSDDIVMDSDRHTIRNDAGACHTLFNGNVIGDLPLPKFSDPRKQNVVEFLAELNDYFKLKNIPDSLKLSLAMKAVTEPYCKNFISAVCKECKNYPYWRAVLPDELEGPIIKYTHESLGHQGTAKCVAQISRSFYMRNVGRKVRRYLAGCDLCQKVKNPNRSYVTEWRSHLPTEPGMLCATDLFGPLPTGRGGARRVL
jgi:hypothetical protein